MRGENLVFLLGRLGGDPELKYTNGGTAYTNVSLATDESYKDKNGELVEKTEWHRLVAWGKTAELLSEWAAKGDMVYAKGKLQTRSWEDKDGSKRYTTEVVVSDFKNCTSKPRSSAPEPEPPEDMEPSEPAPKATSEAKPKTKKGKKEEPQEAPDAHKAEGEDDLPF